MNSVAARPTPAESIFSSPTRRAICLILLGLAGALAFARWHTYDEAIDTDVANFAVIGRGLLQGRQLYSDLFDLKPPLIYALFAAAQVVTPSGSAQLFLLGCFFGWLTLLGVYCAGKALDDRPWSGLVAAAVYTICNNNVQTWSSQLFSEYFEAACFIWVFALALQLLKNPADTRRAMLLGVAMTAATFLKHPALVFWLLVAPSLYWLVEQTRRPAALRSIAIATTVIALSWCAFFFYFSATDRLQDVWDALVTMNRHNAARVFQNNLPFYLSSWLLAFYAQHTLLVIQAIFLAIGVALGGWRGPRRPWIFFLVALAAIGVVVTLPLRPFHYYFQLWIPFLAVGCGWSWRALAEFRARVRVLPEVALVAVVTALLWVQVPWFTRPVRAWSEARRGSLLNDTQQLGRELPHLLRPDETFYMWGGETGLYFESQRLPPTGFINIDSVEEGPIASRLSRRFLTQLTAHPPELFILLRSNPRMPLEPDCTQVWTWFLHNYGPLPTPYQRGSYLLCCRIGGQLEQRVGRTQPLIGMIQVEQPGNRAAPAK
jgi:hypothetical protein